MKHSEIAAAVGGPVSYDAYAQILFGNGSGMVTPAVPTGYDKLLLFQQITTTQTFTTQINITLVFVAAGTLAVSGGAAIPVPAGFVIELPGTEGAGAVATGTNILVSFYAAS
jgi:hypothetical protein